MDKQTIFSILQIEETKDKGLIKEAYFAILPMTNPEDEPEKFKLLREAYEEAMRLSDIDEQAEEENPLFDHAVTGEWIRQIDAIYQNISRRIDFENWKRLFHADICEDFSTVNVAREELLKYIYNNFRVGQNIYQLMEDVFSIEAGREDLIEIFPSDFIDFVISSKDTKQNFNLEWVKCADDAPLDEFIHEWIMLSRLLSDNELEKAGAQIEKMDQYHIEHPAFTVEKMIYAHKTGNKDEAYRLRELVEPYYDKVSYFEYEGLNIEIEYEGILAASEWLLAFNEKYPRFYGALYHMVDYYIAIEDYVKAKEYCFNIIELDSAMNEIEEKFHMINEKLFDLQKEKVANDPTNKEEVMELAWIYFQRKENKEVLACLDSIEVTDDIRLDYYNLRSRVLLECDEHEQSLQYLLLWLEEIDKLELDGTEKTKRKKMRFMLANYLVSICYFQMAEKEKSEKRRMELLEEAYTYCVFDYSQEKDISLVAEYQLNQANLLFEMKQYEKCIEKCEDILAQSALRQFYPAARKIVMCYDELRQAQNLIDAFYRALEIYKQDSEIYATVIDMFFAYDDYKGVEEFLDMATKNDATSVWIELQATRLQRALADNEHDIRPLLAKYDEIEKRLKNEADESNAKAIEKDTLRLLKGRCETLLRLGLNKDVKKLINPINKKHSKELRLLKVDMLEEMGDLQVALDELEALASEYQNSEVFYRYGNSLVEFSKNTKQTDTEESQCEKKAIEQFKKVLELNKNHPNANNRIMRMYSKRFDRMGKREDYDLAIHYGTEQLSVMDSSYYRIERALIYFDGLQYKESITDCQKAIEYNSENGFAYGNLGIAYVALRQYDEAIEAFKKAVELDVDYEIGFVRMHLAGVYAATNRFNEAIAVLFEVKEHFPQINTDKKLTEYYRRSKQYEMAIECAKEQLKRANDPQSKVRALTTIGAANEEMGDFKQALAFYKKAYKIAPKDTNVIDFLADFYQYMDGNSKKALKYYLNEKNLAENADRKIDGIQGIMQITYHQTKCLKNASPKEINNQKSLLQEAISALEKEHGSIAKFLEKTYAYAIKVYDLFKLYLYAGDLECAKYYMDEIENAPRCTFCQFGGCLELHVAKGLYAEALGNLDEAVAYFKMALEIDPNEAYVTYRLREIEKNR